MCLPTPILYWNYSFLKNTYRVFFSVHPYGVNKAANMLKITYNPLVYYWYKSVRGTLYKALNTGRSAGGVMLICKKYSYKSVLSKNYIKVFLSTTVGLLYSYVNLNYFSLFLVWTFKVSLFRFTKFYISIRTLTKLRGFRTNFIQKKYLSYL